jgi:hypothetical protein
MKWRLWKGHQAGTRRLDQPKASIPVETKQPQEATALPRLTIPKEEPMVGNTGLSQLFELAHGGTIGKDHRDRLFKNYQDSRCVIQTPDLLVCVVTDGCTSGNSSEFGAMLGARVVAKTLQQNVRRSLSRYPGEPKLLEQDLFWVRTQKDILARLRSQASDLILEDESFTDFVEDWLYFTSLGMVATSEIAVFFALGDGLIVVNDERIVLVAKKHNLPPYLGHGLLEPEQVDFHPDELDLKVVRSLPTSQLHRFAIGVDGAIELVKLMDTPGICFPGTPRALGPIEQLWANDGFYHQQHALTLFLRQCNKNRQLVDYDGKQVIQFPGLLVDDTTLVVGRRRVITP